MNVLLTGGAGFIGSHTAVELMDCGHDIIIADNLCNSSPSAIDGIERITGRRPAFYEIDVADGKALDALFGENEIDAVVHFAGLKAVGESTAKPLMYYRNNIGSTLTLLETMASHGCKNIVFSSSATVYGTDNPFPYVETMRSGRCSNPYGWTKYMIEQIMTDAAVADPELSVVLLRYFNPIGAHESGLIGERPQGIPNNLMPYICQVASGIRPQLNVFGGDYPTPDGTGVRDYIHVVDLAKGHASAIEYAAAHKGTEIINLGSGHGSSVLEIVKTFERVNGVEIPYVIAPRRAGDLAEFYADAQKAERLLGWKTRKTLDDMCRDSWNFIVKSRAEA